MIRFTQGNLLDSKAEALVNTVNSVGVMGKGIALMFKEAFPENFKAYTAACKSGEVAVGKMFVTERLGFPRLIINFPTKQHWRGPSRIEWIKQGLEDLKRVITDKRIRSIALPPLGSGNGGLAWAEVKQCIVDALGSFDETEITIYEPTAQYQNVAKRTGVQKLTPARALIAELVRRYCILGMECSILEIQKLAYFLDGIVKREGLVSPLQLDYAEQRYGPYADKLRHLLNGLDGSYLHCDRRLPDAGPYDAIWFEDSQRDRLAAYLASPELKQYMPALEKTGKLIDGFQSPLGMELLATVDWLLHNKSVPPNVDDIDKALVNWASDPKAAERKKTLLDRRLINIALQRLSNAA